MKGHCDAWTHEQFELLMSRLCLTVSWFVSLQKPWWESRPDKPHENPVIWPFWIILQRFLEIMITSRAGILQTNLIHSSKLDYRWLMWVKQTLVHYTTGRVLTSVARAEEADARERFFFSGWWSSNQLRDQDASVVLLEYYSADRFWIVQWLDPALVFWCRWEEGWDILPAWPGWWSGNGWTNTDIGGRTAPQFVITSRTSWRGTRAEPSYWDRWTSSSRRTS